MSTIHDEQTRIAAEDTIKRYARLDDGGNAIWILDLVGWKNNLTDKSIGRKQAPDLLEHLLPILDGEVVDMIMRSIAEMIVRELDAEKRAKAECAA